MRRPLRRTFSAAVLLAIAATSVAAHDLFLKPFSFFVAPNTEARVRVLNGTFEKSENAVARNRIRDLSVVGPRGVEHADTSAWSDTGDSSVFTFRTGPAGTYVVGASTLPRGIKLDGKQFNAYLTSDGVPDVLEARRRAGELDKPSHERYSKHVKTLLQVGDARTGGIDAVLGYPAELVPLDNPYRAKVGGVIRVRALVDGKPVANQIIIAGGRTPTGTRLRAQNVRSDTAGVARVSLGARGYWYVKFIHMVPVAGDSVTYESKWATLTFQVR
jgi:hypothetical protein